MRPHDIPSVATVRRRLFSKIQSERLEAVGDIRKLKRTDALSLLRKAIAHWDRRLVAACAELLAELFGSKATADIIRVVDSASLNHSLAIRLLVQCGTPQAALKIWSLRADPRRDVKALAWESLEILKSPAGAIAICKSCDQWNCQLEKYLDLLPRAMVARAFQSLGTEVRNRLLESNNAREYFRQRRLESTIYPRSSDREWLRNALAQGATLREIGAKFLDRLSRRALSECLDAIPPSERREYLKHRPTSAYLKQRGIRWSDLESEVSSKSAKPSVVTRVAAAAKVDVCEVGLLCSRWALLDDDYKPYKVRKRRGGYRDILAPAPLLKSVQRAINLEILTPARLHPACHGFRKRHSIVSNASPHTGQALVINIDLKDFFPSISAARIYGVYRQLGHPADEARFLTRLSTHNERLPQGAPTSPMLANLVCRRLDSRLSGLANKLGAHYTRYADDLTFSGPRGFVNAMPFIRQIIKEEGLAIAEEKVRLTGRGNRQEVTGLVVNEAVSVPRATRRRLRAALHHLTVGRPLTWNHAEIHLTHLRGHIAFVKSVQPAVGAVFSRQLSRFLPKRKKQKRKSSRSATNAQPPGTTSRQRTSIAAEERTMQTLLATQVADELAALADRPTVLTDLALAIVNGDAAEAKTRYEEACEASITRSCITDAIHAAMARVIRLFNQNEFYVPELLIAARAAFAVAEKARRSASVGTAGRAIIGCVAGDFHDIGKTLVAEMWRLGGFEVIDLGTVNSPKQFLDATRKYNPIVVGLSAGMTTTMPHIKTITEALRSANPSAKIVVGGLPVTKTFAKSIGADGYAPDCVSALELVKQLVRATTAQ